MWDKLSRKFFMELKKAFYRETLKKMAPGFWLTPKSRFEINNISKVYIDLRNIDHAHLGDQLFFISAFLGYKKKSVELLVNKSLNDFYDCYDVTYSVRNPLAIDEHSLYVCPLKSYIEPLDQLISQFENHLVYDLTDSSIMKPLYRHIFEVISGDLKFVNGCSNANCFCSLETSTVLSDFGLQDFRFYVLNDFLYSRSFMRQFLQGALTNKLEEVKSAGFRIIYLGSKKDAEEISPLLGYVDLDLRGKTSFRQLLAIIGSDNCEGYIGFDNALMHAHLLFGKSVFIKFRGRLTRRAKKLHLRSINCAVNSQAAENIVYL